MIMDNLPESWLTMVSLSRSWINMIHGTLLKIMAWSSQDLDKDSKEFAMDLGKGTMASNTGKF